MEEAEVSYDKEADCLYIKFRELSGVEVHTEDLGNGVYQDYFLEEEDAGFASNYSTNVNVIIAGIEITNLSRFIK